MRGTATIVPLPQTRQPLLKFIQYHGYTRQQVADACIGGDYARLSNLAAGKLYPSPGEIEALEALFKLPVNVLLEPCMLVYRKGPWPVPRGTAQWKHEAELRARGVEVDPTPGFYETQLAGWRYVGADE